MRYVMTSNPRSATHYLKLLLSAMIGKGPLEHRLSLAGGADTGNEPSFDLDLALREEAPKRLVFDHFFYAHDAAVIDQQRYPDLRIILLNRHPLDRLISDAAYRHWRRDLNDDGTPYQQVARELLLGMRDSRSLNYQRQCAHHLQNYVSMWLRNRTCHHIKYEDLISEPVRTLAAACVHYELEVTTVQIERALERHSFEVLSGGRKPGEIDAKSHFRSGVSGQWREIFSVQDLKRLQQLHGEQFLLAGYDLAHDISSLTTTVSVRLPPLPAAPTPNAAKDRERLAAALRVALEHRKQAAQRASDAEAQLARFETGAREELTAYAAELNALGARAHAQRLEAALYDARMALARSDAQVGELTASLARIGAQKDQLEAERRQDLAALQNRLEQLESALAALAPAFAPPEARAPADAPPH